MWTAAGGSLLVCFILCVTHQAVNADLPVHATIHDVQGSWKFTLGRLSENPTICAGAVPNTNLENLMQDPSDWFEKNDVATDEIVVTLVDSPRKVEDITFFTETSFPSDATAENEVQLHQLHQLFPGNRRSWNILPVTGASGNVVGYWTMLFDQGYQVTLLSNANSGFTKLLAYMKYQKTEDAKCHPSNTDNEKEDGSTPCYETDPSRTLVAWMSHVSEDGQYKSGCFIGERQFDATDSSAPVAFLEKRATAQLGSPIPHVDPLGVRTYRKTSRMVNGLPSFLKTSSSVDDSSELRTGMYACSTPRNDPLIYNSLPKQFSWGDPFSDPSFTPTADMTITFQGDCGSCYSVTASYILQRRAEIMLDKILGNNKNWRALFTDGNRLSPQAVISCSYYDQGCAGGYPFLVGKWASEFGIASMSCIDYVAKDSKCPLADIQLLEKRGQDASEGGDVPMTERMERPLWSGATNKWRMNSQAVLSPIGQFLAVKNRVDSRATKSCANSGRVYARDYGYVGGCYECCSESAMMAEIQHHGPVTVAFDVAPEFINYKSGVFDKCSSSHSRICDEPEKGLNGWEFTSHALVIVGWGEDPPFILDDEPQKYWIVRNSWGETFGNQGYAKIGRGKNQCGIEAQAVFIDPDPTRGRLRKILEEHGVSPKQALDALNRQYN